MGLPWHEQARRKEIETFYERGEKRIAEDTADIKAQAMAMFEKQLNGKLANMQDGEGLVVTFAIDIVRTDGKVRGGSGAERNMPEYIEWRDAVYRRDGYTCQECGAQSELNAHHIKSWARHPELRFDVSNGVTLCKTCHAKKHPHIGFLKANDG